MPVLHKRFVRHNRQALDRDAYRFDPHKSNQPSTLRPRRRNDLPVQPVGQEAADSSPFPHESVLGPQLFSGGTAYALRADLTVAWLRIISVSAASTTAAARLANGTFVICASHPNMAAPTGGPPLKDMLQRPLMRPPY